ncbi:basic proline-rich protein-like [Manis pentadactyla]|uniref:basic proline-rich protein-like n=1 Tax=Manis pentadactyla TaxID=143292 RepID=UPI00255C9DD8|nr:basic proline-rich protein-like [Manis pentadactyla]
MGQEIRVDARGARARERAAAAASGGRALPRGTLPARRPGPPAPAPQARPGLRLDRSPPALQGPPPAGAPPPELLLPAFQPAAALRSPPPAFGVARFPDSASAPASLPAAPGRSPPFLTQPLRPRALRRRRPPAPASPAKRLMAPPPPPDEDLSAPEPPPLRPSPRASLARRPDT